MQLHSLHVGKPQTIPSSGSSEWWDKQWTTALIKEAVSEPAWLGYEGLKGDAVMYRRKDDRETTLELSQFAALSGSWKDSLYARVRTLENREQ